VSVESKIDHNHNQMHFNCSRKEYKIRKVWALFECGLVSVVAVAILHAVGQLE